MSDNALTFGSLFCGVGGFDLGFERAGMRCVWQVEIDDYANRVLEKHWPNVPRWRDVRTFPPIEWRTDRAVGQCQFVRPDVICGGDPCQGNSNAGNVHKTQHEDIGTEFVRVIQMLRPRVVVRENPARTRPDALWPWQRMRSSLENLGYSVLPFRLRSCCLGLDHQRDRLFLLAELPDASGKRLQGFDREGFTQGDTCRAFSRTIRGITRQDVLPSSRVCRGIDGVSNRMERLRCVGNSISPQVSEYIGKRIVEAHHG